MRRNPDDEPFDDLFEQIERMMNQMMGGQGNVEMDVSTGTTGFGSDTHVDVQEEDDRLRVVADLPGVTKDAIDLTCDGRVLVIRAQGENRQYEESVRLPGQVDEQSASASYNNGVLEVVFDRNGDAADIDVN